MTTTLWEGRPSHWRYRWAYLLSLYFGILAMVFASTALDYSKGYGLTLSGGLTGGVALLVLLPLMALVAVKSEWWALDGVLFAFLVVIGSSDVTSGNWALAVVCAGHGVGGLLWAFLHRYRTAYALTTCAIRLQVGIVVTHACEINLSDVLDVTVTQKTISRLLDVGDILISWEEDMDARTLFHIAIVSGIVSEEAAAPLWRHAAQEQLHTLRLKGVREPNRIAETIREAIGRNYKE